MVHLGIASRGVADQRPVDKAYIRAYARNMKLPCYCSQLRAVTRKVGAIYDDALAPFGVNIAQFSLLNMIMRHQPVSLTQLGRLAELDRSTIGRNIRVLERMELVVAGRGDEDQRAAVVMLTVRGAHIVGTAVSAWEKCQREIEGRLGSVKLVALQEILRSI